MSNAPTDSAAERLKDARMSLKALFLCVDERVAADVRDKVEAAFLALSTPTAVAEGGDQGCRAEEWRDVAGYEGRYQVSNLGRSEAFGAGQ